MPDRPRLRHRSAHPAAEETEDIPRRRLRVQLRAETPPVRGQSSFVAILPSGRTWWLETSQALAPLDQLNLSLAEAAHRTRVRRASIRARGADVARLSRGLAADVRRLADARQEAHRKLGRALIATNARIERRMTRTLDKVRSRIEKQAQWHHTAVRRLARRNLWNALIVDSGLLLLAVFGRKDPLAANNIAVVVLLLVWLVGDSVMDLISGRRPDPRYGIRDTDLWTYLAPFANVLTGWLLLRPTQPERFIAGFASELTGVPPPQVGRPISPVLEEKIYVYSQAIALEPLIGDDRFQTLIGVPVVAVVASFSVLQFSASVAGTNPHAALSASVLGGTLTVIATIVLQEPPAAPFRAFDTIVDRMQVAWILDTQKP